MSEISTADTGKEKAKAKLLNSFEYLLANNGSGHLEVNTKILKRGQKEITIQCSRSYRFIVDAEKEGGDN